MMTGSKKAHKNPFRFKLRFVAICVTAGLVSACSAPSAISSKTRDFTAPLNWQEKAWQEKNGQEKDRQAVSVSEQEYQSLTQDWLGITADKQLQQAISIALENNYDLKVQSFDVAIAKERLTQSNASDFPELSLGLSQQRRKVVDDSSSSISNTADLSIDLSYEVDIWGKLSDSQKQANLNYAATKAKYNYQRKALVASVTKAWFTLLSQQNLYQLYLQRAANLENNLSIIQSSYRLGLSSALDVYLTQNEVSNEKARIEQQKQQVVEAKRALQLLVAQYPDGSANNQEALFSSITETTSLAALEKYWVTLSDELYTELPAQMLTQRQDITASWLELMALDAGLAVAHKQRFPQFKLSASAGDSSDELSNLLSSDVIAWSLLGNVTAPLFNAGRLKSVEEQARLSVYQKEQSYLSTLYKAFADAENQLNNHSSLTARLNLLMQAQENALAAESLSFNQYQKGLVSYATVLESQRRAFDTQTSVIQVKNQLIQNRVDIYQSMGNQVLDQAETISAGR